MVGLQCLADLECSRANALPDAYRLETTPTQATYTRTPPPSDAFVSSSCNRTVISTPDSPPPNGRVWLAAAVRGHRVHFPKADIPAWGEHLRGRSARRRINRSARRRRVGIA